jgi:hypothetical protein
MADAERAKAEAMSGGMKKEELRQLGLIYGGLIGVAVVMVQPSRGDLAQPLRRDLHIAFAVAIPLMTGLVMLNRQEAFRRRTSSAKSPWRRWSRRTRRSLGWSRASGISAGPPSVLPGQRARGRAGVLGGLYTARRGSAARFLNIKPSESPPGDRRPPLPSPGSRGIGPAAAPRKTGKRRVTEES